MLSDLVCIINTKDKPNEYLLCLIGPQINDCQDESELKVFTCL